MSNNNEKISLIDCPRDAIQGISHFISTEKKVDYLNKLIDSQLFDCIDFGSFVSPKSIPQLQDTASVIQQLNTSDRVKLLAIVANLKGAELASVYDKIDFLGYPFSISETFQLRNTNASIAQSVETVKSILEVISSTNQQLVVYISMAFGNPYGDSWHSDLAVEWIQKLKNIGVNNFSIADTTAEATSNTIHDVFAPIVSSFPDANISIHLHSKPEDAREKIDAAYDAGCRRFEGALLGYGGCPFAKSELVGNIASELLLSKFRPADDQKVNELTSSFQQMIS